MVEKKSTGLQIIIVEHPPRKPTVEDPEIRYGQKTLTCKCGSRMMRVDQTEGLSVLCFWCKNCGRIFEASAYTRVWLEPKMLKGEKS